MNEQRENGCRRLDSVKRVELIEVEFLRGEGVVGDVSRIVTQYWSEDGELLAENDPFPSNMKIVTKNDIEDKVKEGFKEVDKAQARNMVDDVMRRTEPIKYTKVVGHGGMDG